MRDFIPQIEPWIDDNELKHLKRVIDSTFVVESVLTKEFETLVKEHTNSKYALSMTNGTAALYCALLTLGVKDGDEEGPKLRRVCVEQGDTLLHPPLRVFLEEGGGGFPSRMLTRWVSVKDDQGRTSNSRSFL